MSHKPGGRLPLLSARSAVTSQPLRGLLPILLLGEQRHNGCEQFGLLPDSVAAAIWTQAILHLSPAPWPLGYRATDSPVTKTKHCNKTLSTIKDIHFCSMTNYELLRWLVKMQSREFWHGQPCFLLCCRHNIYLLRCFCLRDMSYCKYFY